MNDNFGFAQVVPDPLKISLKPFEAKSPNGKKDKKAKNDFAKVLHSEIVGGFITNRNQLIGYMKKNGMDITKIGDDFITVRLPGAKKNTRLKGPLFRRDSDYAQLVNEHHQSKIPKFLTPDEAQSQRDKLIHHIEARTAFNQRRYLSPKPGAKRTHKPFKKPSGVTKEHEEKPIPTKVIRSALEEQLTQLKEQSDPATKLPTTNLPHHIARRQDQQECEGPLSRVMGGSAVGGLEAQIGSLSMQYHSLLLQLAGAKGQRASQIKSQLMAMEQKLIALNLELEKKKAQHKGEKDLKIK